MLARLREIRAELPPGPGRARSLVIALERDLEREAAEDAAGEGA